MKRSKKPNIILIVLDTVRSDHLGCYGYKKIETPNIDKIAEEGVCFETCIASSIFTPVAMSTVLGGAYANKIGLRNMYSTIRSKLVSSVLQENGYRTTAFVGVCHLSSKHGFSAGFDTFHEVTEETAWASHAGHEDFGGAVALAGYYWVDDFFEWLENNHKNEPFFVWGHFFETHEGSEYFLIEKGLIKEGILPEFSYYDAKIEMADRELLGRLNEELKKLGIEDNTIVIIQADHGESLGEHVRDPEVLLTKKGEKVVKGGKWRKYPTHSGMHDTDVKVPLIMKGPGLPSGKRIKSQVRTIDITPTILDLLKIKPENHFDHELDGVSLLPVIEKGRAEGSVAYIEDLTERRVYGLQQAMRTDEYKYMRNLRNMEEEFYRLYRDPEERCNVFDITGTEKLTKWEAKLIDGWRKEMNYKLWLTVGSSEELLGKEGMEERLRALGYISEE